MESSGRRRSGLPAASGILSIIAGALQVIIGGVVVALISSPGLRRALLPPIPLPWMPPGWYEHFAPAMPTWLSVLGVLVLVLGIVAIIGGVAALRRSSFGLSLAGAICALPIVVLGIPAIILVSLSGREFGTDGRENSV
jgi:apolipoprotein N-acyltransferase